MGLVKTGGLALAFTLAADVAMAGGLGMIGVHGFVVDGGAQLGEALGVPQLDWSHLWEEWEFEFLDPQTDPCLSTGGHYHGSFCHYGSDGPVAGLPNPSLSLPPGAEEEALEIG